MTIWSAEIKELKNLLDSFQGQFSDLEKELKPLITSEDPNVVLLYSRRCLEVIVTELCEVELKRPRKTEPLKGIIDKLNSEGKVSSHIITSMHSLNSLSTYGTHPKDFEVEQVKPVLNNLFVIIKWYLKYKESQTKDSAEVTTQKAGVKMTKLTQETSRNKTKEVLIYSISLLVILAVVFIIVKTNFLNREIEKSIAVLPFRNDSPEDSTQYFMDGVMEELLNKLQSLKSLRVVGRTSVEQFRRQDKSIPEIAKELGVNYIVEGSGQKSGNSLRMRVQLLVARNESHLWGNSFEQENLDMRKYFKAQSGFAEAIANELNAAMSSDERMLIEKTHDISFEVYDNYLKASQNLGDVGKESLQKALDYLNNAIKKEPGWAPLYIGLVQTWLAIQQMGFEPPSVAMPEIYRNLNKALELDPNLSEAHYLNAMIAHVVEWDWEKSEKEFLEALAVNPNDASSRALYAQLLCILQRSDEGVAQGRLALQLDPLNPYVKIWVAAILNCVGDCKTSLILAEEVTADDHGNYLANQDILIAAYICKKYDKVINAEKYNLAPFNVTEDDMKEIERIFNEQGFIKAFEKIMILLEKFAENNPISPMDLAVRYLMAGQPEKALDWLEKGYEMHDPTMTYIATKIFNFEPLFNNSRFLDIVKKMNLPLPKTNQ
jgi:TolB-like protein